MAATSSRSERSDSVFSESGTPASTARRLSSGLIVPGIYNLTNLQDGMKQAGQSIVTGSVTLAGEVSFGDEDAMVVRLTRDRQHWAVGLSKGMIKFYPVKSDNRAPVYSLIADGETIACTDMDFVPYQDYFPSEKKHIMIAAYASGRVRIWHYTGATPKSRLLSTMEEIKIPPIMVKPKVEKAGAPKEFNQIMACSCSLDGLRFVTGGDDCVVRVYDIAKRTVISRLSSTNTSDRMDGHVMRICALRYHPWGDRHEDYAHIFVSGGWDDSVQIWDDRHAHSLWQYFGPHVCGTDAIDIDPEQNHIVTGSWRRERAILQVWKFNDDVVHDLKEGTETRSKFRYDRPIAELEQDATNMPTMGYVARWLGNQYILYGGSNGNMIKVIDRGSLNTVGSVVDLPNGVYSIAGLMPLENDKRPLIRIAFCCGTKLLLLKMEKKI